jgi:hypothetical protein
MDQWKCDRMTLANSSIDGLGLTSILGLPPTIDHSNFPVSFRPLSFTVSCVQLHM